MEICFYVGFEKSPTEKTVAIAFCFAFELLYMARIAIANPIL